jgi:hypothetical protein
MTVNRGQKTKDKGQRTLKRDEALARLKRLKDRFSAHIAKRFAWKAKDCSTCSTPCCADAEFVNVNVTRLEGEAIMRTLRVSPRITPEHRERIVERARDAVRRYGLDAAIDTFSTTYACPLYEPGVGCLVHYKAKPAPCTQHGCYDEWQDLPDEIEMRRTERNVADLNRALYREDEPYWGFRTIPVWVATLADEGVEAPTPENATETEPDAPLVRISRKR